MYLSNNCLSIGLLLSTVTFGSPLSKRQGGCDANGICNNYHAGNCQLIWTPDIPQNEPMNFTIRDAADLTLRTDNTDLLPTWPAKTVLGCGLSYYCIIQSVEDNKPPHFLYGGNDINLDPKLVVSPQTAYGADAAPLGKCSTNSGQFPGKLMCTFECEGS